MILLDKIAIRGLVVHAHFLQKSPQEYESFEEERCDTLDELSLWQ
jgi:hypothetical protein